VPSQIRLRSSIALSRHAPMRRLSVILLFVFSSSPPGVRSPAGQIAWLQPTEKCRFSSTARTGCASRRHPSLAVPDSADRGASVDDCCRAYSRRRPGKRSDLGLSTNPTGGRYPVTRRLRSIDISRTAASTSSSTLAPVSAEEAEHVFARRFSLLGTRHGDIPVLLVLCSMLRRSTSEAFSLVEAWPCAG